MTQTKTHKHIIPHDYCSFPREKLFRLIIELNNTDDKLAAMLLPEMIQPINPPLPPITAILSPEDYDVGDSVIMQMKWSNKTRCCDSVMSNFQPNWCSTCDRPSGPKIDKLTPPLEIKGKEVVEITHNYFSMVTVNGNIVKSESEEESFIHSIGFESISQFFTRYNESTTINLYKFK